MKRPLGYHFIKALVQYYKKVIKINTVKTVS